MSKLLPASEPLETYWCMLEPPESWLTKPISVTTPGNPVMEKVAKDQLTQPSGAGKEVIRSLVALYRARGRRVLLFESSQAAQRITEDLMGHPNPDDVFDIDVCSGACLKNTAHLGDQPGRTEKSFDPNFPAVNVVPRATAPSRMIEHMVILAIATRLRIKNIYTQPDGAQLEGGDFGIAERVSEANESLLVTGSGHFSRSNDAGRRWLENLFAPDYHITIESEGFHRDLVSVLVEGKDRHLVQALLATGGILNGRDVAKKLRALGVDIINVPLGAVGKCAVNLSVSPGDIIGMQREGELVATLRALLHEDVTYASLPDKLQSRTEGFIGMQGGANCVSGRVIARKSEIDDSPENIAAINGYLHSDEFARILKREADRLEMSRLLTKYRVQS